MVCPECRRNTLKPVFTDLSSPYLDGRPASPVVPARRSVSMFRCSNCPSYFLAYGYETAAEAYWRIISDYAKD